LGGGQTSIHTIPYLSTIRYSPKKPTIMCAPLIATLCATAPANYQSFRHSLGTRNWSHLYTFWPPLLSCRIRLDLPKTTQYNEQLIGESSRTFTMSTSSSVVLRTLAFVTATNRINRIEPRTGATFSYI